jgi:hypothetical protein
MKIIRFWVIASVAVLLFIQACASPEPRLPATIFNSESGQKIDPIKVGQIVDRKTTEKEVVALLGTPQTVQNRPDGSKVLIYSYHQTKIYGQPSLADTKGGSIHEMLLLGIRNGVVMKKWQSNFYTPTKSVMGQTLNVPQEFK